MRTMIIILALMLPYGAWADTPSASELDKTLKSYRESSALLHKADSFIYARRAYMIARQLYEDKPEELGPIAYTYALAAARYQEPVALEQYEIALKLLKEANGTDSQKLVPILTDAADEAIHRREPEKAYTFTKNAQYLIELHDLSNSFYAARTQMALARQYWNSDEKERAVRHAGIAKQLAARHYHETNYPNHANLLYWHGQIMRWHGDYIESEPSYEKALSILLKREPRSRKVLSIHKHMVAVSHHLANQERLTYHCIEAEKWKNVRGMSYYHWPVFDPSGQTEQMQRVRKGQFIASFTRGADCKARNVVILKAKGITNEEARLILANAYIPPKFQNGTLLSDQLVDQGHFNVY